MYQDSLPVFLRYLDRLSELVDVAEAHVQSQRLEPSSLLDARLAPDMLPFEVQVQIAANFALRACFPLAGEDIPPYGDFPATFEGLRARITRVLGLLKSLRPEQFERSEERVIESKAGNAILALPAPEFLLQYALPNFFFHVTTAYAILRSRGVIIGKAQFDGYHSYPPA